jgi:hypothetical protein
MPIKMPSNTSPPAGQIIAVDEGDDATSATLSFSLDASGTVNASTYAWTCTAVPGAGDPAFPSGTTTGAQTIDSPSSATTDVTVTGPGRYVFTLTPDGDASKAQTVSVLVSRPLPVLTTDLSSGGATGGATTSISLGDSAGADGVTYSTTAHEYPLDAGIAVTDGDTDSPEFSNPAQDTDGKAVQSPRRPRTTTGAPRP